MYLRYLLLHPTQYTNEQVREICNFNQIDFLGDWYLERLRLKLCPPVPFYPFDPNHRESHAYLMETGLFWIFLPDKYGDQAFEILGKPRFKEFVETSLICFAESQAITNAMWLFFRYECPPEAIDRYRTFFWDMELLDSTELRALISLRSDVSGSHDNAEIKKQHEHIKNASYRDSRRAAANMPFSPLAFNIAQMKMGFMPSEVDVQAVVRQSQVVASARLNEAMMSEGKGDSVRAADFSAVLERLIRIERDNGNPREDLQASLATITMKTDDAPLPTIYELSQGRHTAEVVVMEKTNAIPAEYDDGDGGDEPSLDGE